MFGLVTGRDYLFRVLAYNFNGEGNWSDYVKYYSCLPPSVAAAPTRITSTTTSLSIAWTAPADDGGCDITSFAVFSDDGLGGASTEVNQPNDPLVRNRPGLYNLVITSPFSATGQDAGKSYKVYVVSYNIDGQKQSDTALITLGKQPDAPPSPPRKNQS